MGGILEGVPQRGGGSSALGAARSAAGTDFDPA